MCTIVGHHNSSSFSFHLLCCCSISPLHSFIQHILTGWKWKDIFTAFILQATDKGTLGQVNKLNQPKLTVKFHLPLLAWSYRSFQQLPFVFQQQCVWAGGFSVMLINSHWRMKLKLHCFQYRWVHLWWMNNKILPLTDPCCCYWGSLHRGAPADSAGGQIETRTRERDSKTTFPWFSRPQNGRR